MAHQPSPCSFCSTPGWSADPTLDEVLVHWWVDFWALFPGAQHDTLDLTQPKFQSRSISLGPKHQITHYYLLHSWPEWPEAQWESLAQVNNRVITREQQCNKIDIWMTRKNPILRVQKLCCSRITLPPPWKFQLSLMHFFNVLVLQNPPPLANSNPFCGGVYIFLGIISSHFSVKYFIHFDLHCKIIYLYWR